VPGLSPKLPLHIDKIDGYGLTKNFKEVARQNLKMVVLTNPGERIMLPNFGVGIKTYLFENADTFVFEEIEEKIRQQVRTYLPYITIDDINFFSERNNFNETEIEPSSLSNYVHIQIKYRIPTIFISDTLSLEI
jgi:phage baseplate assembly protein W|tara:strand:+ start:236 stop:637 length:402 start_codon:yes stop_codon:yes gene_type:complete